MERKKEWLYNLRNARQAILKEKTKNIPCLSIIYFPSPSTQVGQLSWGAGAKTMLKRSSSSSSSSSWRFLKGQKWGQRQSQAIMRLKEQWQIQPTARVD